MSLSIKCLIDFNNNKYSLCIKSDFNEITFKCVLNELQKQINQNISLKTHDFQIFEKDFEEYVLIINEKQIIHNLSRIRVSEKSIENNNNINSNENIGVFGNNCFKEDNNKCINSSNIYQIFDKIEINSNTNLLNTEKIKSKDINNEKVVINEELNSISNIGSNDKTLKLEFEGKRNTTVSEDTTQSNAIINYFGPNVPYFGQCFTLYQMKCESNVIQIGDKSTVVLKISAEDMKAFNLLIQLMQMNVNLFQNNTNHILMNQKWKVISKEMITNGFIEWIPYKCRDSFVEAINWYQKILENAPNLETASAVYPLFVLINSLDLKYFINDENLNKIEKLRKGFPQKCSNNSSSQMPKVITNEKGVIKVEISDNWSIQTNDKLLASTSKSNKGHQLFHSNSVVNKRSKALINNNLMTRNQLISKTYKLTKKDMKAFRSMVGIINSITAQFEPIIRPKMWELVSTQMKRMGYQSFDAKKCKNKFDNYVCDAYKLALIYCPDSKTASSIYPLFAFIHSMDLSKTLSNNTFNTIQILRQRFHMRCAFNKT